MNKCKRFKDFFTQNNDEMKVLSSMKVIFEFILLFNKIDFCVLCF